MARGQEQEKVGAHQAGLRWSTAALLIGNLCLSTGPLFVRMADTGPVAAAFWRIAIAAPLLFVIAKMAGDPARKPDGKLFWIFAASGLLFALDLAAWHLGILETKLANANLLGNSTSFLLPLWAFAVARAWPTRRQGLALALAAAGTALLLGRSFELSVSNLRGDLLCLLAGAFYTAYLIVLTGVRDRMGAWPVLAWSTATSIAPLLLMALLLGEQVMPRDWTPLVALALVSQIIGQGLMIWVIDRVSPLLFGLALLTQPMVSATLGWTIYGERLAPADWAGAALIALALLLVRGKA